MGKILIISEKPKVTKELMKSSRFHGSKKIEGSKPFFGYYENETYINTWARGHLLELYNPQDYDPQYKQFKFENLPLIFDTKYKVIQETKEQYETIRKLMLRNDVDSIINATDDDREGELIFREIYETIGCIKPVFRLALSSYELDELEAALNSLKHGKDYDLISDSAKARQYLDHLIGDTLTRAATVKFADNKFLLSGGRVQTCLLNEINKRQKEAETFVSKNFYLLYLNVGFIAKQPLELASMTYDNVKTLGESLKGNFITVVDFKDNKTVKRPKNLYNLTDLYKDIIKEFKMASPKAKKVIQKLYDDGYITYPRTDSRHLPASMIERVQIVLKSHLNTHYGPLIENIEIDNINNKHKTFNDELVTGHYAIMPTKNILPSDRSEDEKKIYDLIMERFIANWMEAAEFHVREVILKDDKDNLFIAKEKVLIKPGFLNVFKEDKEEDETTNFSIPELKENDRLKIEDYSVHTGKTTKPLLHTESSILTFLETAGRNLDDENLRELMKGKRIGTVATEESFIPKLIERGYIELKGNYLYTTQLGATFIEKLPINEIKDPIYTAEMEFKIQQIQSNELSLKDFKKIANDFAHYIVQEMSKINTNTIIEARNDDIEVCKCSCGKQIVDKGNFYGCIDYPNCKEAIPKKIKGKSITKAQVEMLYTKGTTDLIKGFKNNEDKTFDAYIIKSNKGLNFRFPTAEDLSLGICPKCKKGYMLDKESLYGCSEYMNGCDYTFPAILKDNKIPKAQIKKLFKNGHTDFINGFIPEEGKEFTAAIVIQSDLSFKFQFPTKEDRTIGKCPLCGNSVLVGKSYYLCEQYKQSCDFIIPGVYLEKVIPGTQIKKLLEKNITDTIEGFISPKTGNKFKAKLSYDAKEKRLKMIFPKGNN